VLYYFIDYSRILGGVFMKIQKGIVKYKDRTDIVCTYGVTDAGVQYYFLDEKDEKRFSNGNRIASTELVEAIDPMYKASHVGVIDSVGNVVIPFDNKSIRPVNDDIILVEKAKPVSQSVIDAVNLKSDPLAATKLVSTPATIKDKLNSKMGPEGRYVFNDQFSEATVCDINGNNLVNNEYFSFIGHANNKLYFSRNTVDSEITEYSILPPEVQSDITPASDTKEIDVSAVSVSKDVVEGALNGENTQSPVVEETPKLDEGAEHVQEAVQNDALAMPSVEADNENNTENTSENNNVDDLDATMNIPFPTDMTPDEMAVLAQGIDGSADALANEAVSNGDTATEKVDLEEPTVAPEAVASEESTPVEENATTEEKDVALEGVVPEEAPAVEETTEAEEKDMALESVAPEETPAVEETAEAEDKDVAAESVILEETPTVEETAEVEGKDVTAESVISEEPVTVEETPVEESTAMSEDNTSVADEEIDFKLDLGDSTSDSDNTDTEVSEVSEEVEASVDSTTEEDAYTEFNDSDLEDDIDSYHDSFEDSELVSPKDTIMEDVAKSMTSLIAQNKEQKEKIAKAEQENARLRASRQNMVDKVNHQEKKIDMLVGKLKSLEGALSKMEASNHAFENKIHEQERTIASQTRELETMRVQLEGKEDLVKLLADAQALLGQDSTFDYGTDDSYYRKAA